MATLNPSLLKRYRVLVVDDEYYIASELALLLRMHGAEVLGPVATASEARVLADELLPDCVLLDIHLGSEDSFAFAEELRSQQIPTIFATGYDREVIPERLRDIALIQKPFELPALCECIRACPRRGLDA